MTTTLARMRVMVKHIASIYLPMPGYSAPEQYIRGVETLRDALLNELDVGDFADPSAVEVHDAARQHCFEMCPYGKLPEPGKNPACHPCRLRKFTIDALQIEAMEAAREAKESDE